MYVDVYVNIVPKRFNDIPLFHRFAMLGPVNVLPKL